MCLKYYEQKDSTGEPLKYGDITIKIKSSKEKMPDLIVRKFEISKEGSEPKIITHI